MDLSTDSPAAYLKHKHRQSSQSSHLSLPSRPPTPLGYLQSLPSKGNLFLNYSRHRPTAMRSSESHPNLQSMANLSIEDRESLAVPAAIKRPLSSGPTSRSSVMTPPQLLASDPAMYEVKAKMTSTSPIFASTRDNDDDVFGGADLRPRAQIISHHEHDADSGDEPKMVGMDHYPRTDRFGVKMTSENAQNFLSPHHVVFVANLATDTADRDLIHKCHIVFKKWGECFVKIRRDDRGHPFGYVQYYNAESAKAAIEGGNGVVIDGRKVRTEEAEVNRDVILTRRGGGPVTPEDAQELLGRYGSIEEIAPTTNYDSATHNIGEGMRVKFAIWGDYEDAKKFFNRRNPDFRIYPAPRPQSKTPKYNSRYNPDRSNRSAPTPRSLTDQRSLFIGNLPPDTHEEDLCEIFGKSGMIVSCNIIRKPITGGSGQNVFAFIEFDTVTQAQAALDTHTAVDIHGQRVRVEGKEYSSRAPGRNQFYNHQSGQSNTPRGRDWDTPRSMYQSPHMMSPGFFPFMPSPYGPYTPIPPAMYGYGPTPPTSGHQPGAQLGYMVPGSPSQGAQFIPIDYNRPAMAPSAPEIEGDAPVMSDRPPHEQKRWR